ncbi:hypothetical protein AOX55_00005336 (plasmid) [Sinorhizobium fredii CCBAU 25509]|nr:hypothetical protein AOX55_00005336 [Sinorhizobium fredii CCBAU 25509]
MDLIDMMELGCSLGPFDVWVEMIHRTPVDGGGDQVRDRPS